MRDILLERITYAKRKNSGILIIEDDEMIDAIEEMLEKNLFCKNTTLLELIKWLKGEKYLIDEHSTTMTEDYEQEHRWELSRNIMINKTVKKIEEMIGE